MAPAKKPLADKILKKIQDHHLTPRPRWHYIVKDAAFWGLYFGALILGSGAIGVMLFAFFETDFDLLSYVPGNQLASFLHLLPLYWIVFFCLFSALAIWGAQRTKKGYRISICILILSNLVISLALGSGLYYSGGGERLERVFSRGVPFYRPLEHRREKMWRKVENGFLGGKILALHEDKILILSDFDEKEWEVDYSEARFRRPIELQEGLRIRLIGIKISENQFKADVIRPWRKKRGPGFPRRGMKP